MSSLNAYQHPQFVAANRLRLSVHDAGFQWGATVTDRVRTFNGRLFRVQEHLQRFRASCRLAHIPVHVTNERIVEVSERLVTINREGLDLAVIWVATPGEKSGFAFSSSFIAYTQNLSPLNYRRILHEGARLLSRPATLGADPLIKHRSRLAWWIASEEVHELDPHAEPLFLDPTTNAVLETPTANILAFVDGTLVSPPPGHVLDGVSLRVVEELAQTLGVPFDFRELHLNDLRRASEVLLTNSSFCVVGVSCLDGLDLPFPGPMLGRLLDAWSDLVGVDLRQEMSGDS